LRQMASRFHGLPGLISLELWQATAGGYQPLDGLPVPPPGRELGESAAMPYWLDGPRMEIVYPTLWLPGFGVGTPGVRIMLPLSQGGRSVGLARAHFSLVDVAGRLQRGLQLVVLYALLYAVVVLWCGLYLMQRHVVKPTLQLLDSTRQVAAGDLTALVPQQGPREIADLGASFNAMVEALRDSRQSTEEHIVSLQAANRELEQTRDELVRSAKMATVGHLAAGMAHEIGNPLAAIVGYLELIKTGVGHGVGDLADRASGEAERIQRLVRDLLDYAAPAASQKETFDPAGVIAEALSVVGGQGLLENLPVDNSLPAALPPVTMVRHQLLQVVINLLLNARDACISSGGGIRLEGGHDTDHVWLSVADQGAGIAPDIQDHIFDPFFTTKAPGKGRGLGLAVCHQIMDSAGGRISVVSQPGLGTRFTLRLPPA
jgi:two-component system, NtrC family, sensor kinase